MAHQIEFTAKMKDSYRVVADLNGFEVVMDKPIEVGGENTGNSPGAVLAASIMGCKAMVARYFCEQYKIPLRGIELKIVGDRERSKERGPYRTYHVDLYVDADIDEEMLQKLNTSVERNCTVANIVKGENDVTSAVHRK